MTYSPGESGHTTVNTTRARQGRWGKHVFWVLVFGTLLAGLGMFLAWTFQADANGPAGTGQEQASGRAYDTPAPPSPTPTPGAPQRP